MVGKRRVRWGSYLEKAVKEHLSEEAMLLLGWKGGERTKQEKSLGESSRRCGRNEGAPRTRFCLPSLWETEF